MILQSLVQYYENRRGKSAVPDGARQKSHLRLNYPVKGN